MKKINALQSFGVLLCLQMLTCSLRQCEEKLLWQVRLGRALDLALTVISLGVRSSTLQAEYIFTLSVTWELPVMRLYGGHGIRTE